jgi:hypothetical protein
VLVCSSITLYLYSILAGRTDYHIDGVIAKPIGHLRESAWLPAGSRRAAELRYSSTRERAQ